MTNNPRGTILHFGPNNRLWMDGTRYLNIETTEGVDYRVPSCLIAELAIDPASCPNLGQITLTVPCVGAAIGDFAIASWSAAANGLIITARISVADQVTVSFLNVTGAAVDLAAGTAYVMVFKK